jgi:hypothetical protein
MAARANVKARARFAWTAEQLRSILTDKDEKLTTKLTRVWVSPHPRFTEDGVEMVDGYWRVIDDLATEEPVERLTALEGAWARWEDTLPWEQNASALNDPAIRVIGQGEFGSVKSQSGAHLGATAATWQGDHIRVNAEVWDRSDPESRRFLLAHEASHAAAADFLANIPQDKRQELLAPFKAANGGYSESARFTPDDEFARQPEEMLSDIGAIILMYGPDVLMDRYRRTAEVERTDLPDERLVAIYDQVSESLRRVGLLPKDDEENVAFTDEWQWSGDRYELARVYVRPHERLRVRRRLDELGIAWEDAT